MAGAAIAQDLALDAADWTYLNGLGIKQDDATIKHSSLLQRAHLHFLINDLDIKNRADEVSFYLDFLTVCPTLLFNAGVSVPDCDKPPPGHP